MSPRTVLALLCSSVLVMAQEKPLAVAGNGEPILHPLSKRTRSVPVADTPDAKKVEIPLAMEFVPAGEFTFGTGNSARKVTLGAYAIGRFSVTHAEYAAFLAAEPKRRAPKYWVDRTPPAGAEAHPVVHVSLDDARAYAAWVAAGTGFRVAIPTAEQWEHAARGPAGTLYPWGDSPEVTKQGNELKTRCRYNAVTAMAVLTADPPRQLTFVHEQSRRRGETVPAASVLSVSSRGSVRGWVDHDAHAAFLDTDVFHAFGARGGDTAPVGSYPEGRSAFGCHDMAGNVWNWTETRIVARNGREKGKEVHDIRGGSWYSHVTSCKSVSIGEGREPRGNYNTVGFRLVAAIGEPGKDGGEKGKAIGEEQALERSPVR